MIHVGMGPTHLVNFLGQCNIPPTSEPFIRKHVAKVGKAITDVALESCRAAQVEEKQTSDTLQASVDGGWQKSGTGWNYNSISGHASLIGKNTGKFLHMRCEANAAGFVICTQSRITLFPVMIAHKIGPEVARRRKLTWQCQWHINLQIMTLCFRFCMQIMIPQQLQKFIWISQISSKRMTGITSKKEYPNIFIQFPRGTKNYNTLM
eukprot:XP_011445812.1 PREDICTED: uncharacterized protein LOC105341150 [Crassostrea gigas]